MNNLPYFTELVNEIEMFDAHEHVAGFDWGFCPDDAPIGPTHPRLKSLPHVLMNDMLLYLTGATGLDSSKLSTDQWQVEQAPEYWRAIQPVLEEVRHTPVYTFIRRGLKELFGFEGDEIGDDNWEELNDKIVKTYAEKGASQWLSEVAEKANIGAMVQMAHLSYMIEYWPSLEPERRAREKKLLRPALILEPFFFSGFQPDRKLAAEHTMKLMDTYPANYDEHVAWMHAAMKRHKEEGGVAVKFICAYQRSLHFENVPDSDAKALYARGPQTLDEAQMTRLQDNLVWNLVRMARDLELPIILHTGYSTPTTFGHPEAMFDMVRHPDFASVPFDFAHAGWPHDGAMAIMARTYANVYCGFCGMPNCSPTLATRLMDEMLEIIPANKVLFGIDVGGPEVLYGTTLASREIIAKVLAGKVDSGQISRRAGTTLAHRLLQDNGARLFGGL